MPVNNFDFEKADGIIDNIQNMAVGRAPISGQGIFDFVSVMQTGFGDGSTGRFRFLTGEWTPDTDTETEYLTFDETMDQPPFAFFIWDSAGLVDVGDQIAVAYFNGDQFFGDMMTISPNLDSYGFYFNLGVASGPSLQTYSSRMSTAYDNPADTNPWESQYYSRNDSILATNYPYTGVRYYRQGHTYKWLAIFKPEA